MKKIAILVAALLVLVVGISGCISNNSTSNQTSSNQSQEPTISNDSNNSNNPLTNSSSSPIISPEKAQEIAQKYIEEPGATAGTPQLVDMNGNPTYAVPVVMNGKTVGEIDIDAHTGQNVGGAGGVDLNST